MIRERTRAALDVKRGRHERISRHAPYGWDFGPDGMLVENPKQQRGLGRIKALHAEGKSLRDIADLLNREGVAPQRGGRWSHSSVVRILGRTKHSSTTA
jgi:DNA invertase Pin-like site-specific DNA recombinase